MREKRCTMWSSLPHPPHTWQSSSVGPYECDGIPDRPAAPVPPRAVLGLQVHYRPMPAEAADGCWAAVVTRVEDADGGVVRVTVFPPDQPPGNCTVPVPWDGTGRQPHSWHWSDGEQGCTG